MPTDPRLSSLVDFVTEEMAHPGTGPIAALTHRLGDLDRRIAALERAATIQTGAGSPTTAGLTGRDGTPYAQTTGPALWIRMSGTWHGVNLPL